jgi:hypothetical protein
MVYSVVNNSQSSSQSTELKAGFYPRVGFYFGYFNINIDYNIIRASQVPDFSNNTSGKTAFKNSYIGIRIGGFFWGGTK